MKQLLLRVPDELHERLARRAAAEGTSVNALATGVLDVAVLDVAVADAATGPRLVLRARAAAAGLSVAPPPPPPITVTVPALADVQALLGTLDVGADELLDEQRDPR